MHTLYTLEPLLRQGNINLDNVLDFETSFHRFYSRVASIFTYLFDNHRQVRVLAMHFEFAT